MAITTFKICEIHKKQKNYSANRRLTYMRKLIKLKKIVDSIISTVNDAVILAKLVWFDQAPQSGPEKKLQQQLSDAEKKDLCPRRKEG